MSVAPLVITTASTLPQATAGVPYSVRLTAAAGVKPYIWSFAAGTAPAGLTLHRNGIISGTPGTADGTQPLDVTVTDSAGTTVTATESIFVTPVLSVDGL